MVMHTPVTHTPGHPLGVFRGVRQRRTVPQPREGENWLLQLPSGAWWRMLLGTTRLRNEAGAGSRQAGFQILDPDRVPIWIITSEPSRGREVISGASYGIGPAQEGDVASGITTIEIPDIILEPGWFVGSFTEELRARDQYTKVELLIEEIDNGHRGIGEESKHVDIDLHLGG